LNNPGKPPEAHWLCPPLSLFIPSSISSEHSTAIHSAIIGLQKARADTVRSLEITFSKKVASFYDGIGGDQLCCWLSEEKRMDVKAWEDHFVMQAIATADLEAVRACFPGNNARIF